MLAQTGRIQHRVGLQVHGNTHLLTQTVIGHRKSHRLQHGRVGIQRAFNLGTVNIFSPAQNHVLCPIDQIEKSIFIKITNITRVQPTFDNGLRSRLRTVQVSLDHGRTLNQQFAGLTHWQGFTRFVNHLPFQRRHERPAAFWPRQK